MQAANPDPLNTISQSPDIADMAEIICQLYVLAKVRTGKAVVEQGHPTSPAGVKHEIDQW